MACEGLLVIYVKALLLLLPVGCSRINTANHTTQNKPHLEYPPTSLCMQRTTAEHLAGSQNDDGQEFGSLAHHALTINQPLQTNIPSNIHNTEQLTKQSMPPDKSQTRVTGRVHLPLAQGTYSMAHPS